MFNSKSLGEGTCSFGTEADILSCSPTWTLEEAHVWTQTSEWDAPQFLRETLTCEHKELQVHNLLHLSPDTCGGQDASTTPWVLWMRLCRTTSSCVVYLWKSKLWVNSFVFYLSLFHLEMLVFFSLAESEGCWSKSIFTEPLKPSVAADRTLR